MVWKTHKNMHKYNALENVLCAIAGGYWMYVFRGPKIIGWAQKPCPGTRLGILTDRYYFFSVFVYSPCICQELKKHLLTYLLINFVYIWSQVFWIQGRCWTLHSINPPSPEIFLALTSTGSNWTPDTFCLIAWPIFEIYGRKNEEESTIQFTFTTWIKSWHFVSWRHDVMTFHDVTWLKNSQIRICLEL